MNANIPPPHPENASNPAPRPPLPPPPLPRPSTPPNFDLRRYGTVVKMVSIIVLACLLLIPLALIKGVLGERLERRDEAVAGITSTWGTQQIVVGPVLTIPYKVKVKTWKEQFVAGRTERVEVTDTVIARACFLPATLNVAGTLEPDRLYRGIYETVVYRGKLALTGQFAKPAFDEWKVEPEDILWEDARIVFEITDLRGAKEALSVKWGEDSFPLTPGAKLLGCGNSVQARLKNAAQQADPIPFSVDLTLNGSRRISFAPLGRQTQVQLKSTWPDPSFTGAFLPSERKVGPDGFDATWHLSYYGRSYPQQWSDQDRTVSFDAAAVNASLFGVDLISVVDSYRYVERSIKYGILFIVLVFTAFFLFEILAPLRIHPFQYTLVGVALCLFYLALISLSEIIAFGAAYLIGAAAATLLVTFYSAAMLKSARRTTVIALGLAAVYGFLYVILRLQDYSLLFGTAGLFLVLGIVMYATRNIDWYARDNG